jgi:hypothetical protein
MSTLCLAETEQVADPQGFQESEVAGRGDRPTTSRQQFGSSRCDREKSEQSGALTISRSEEGAHGSRVGRTSNAEVHSAFR